MEIVPARRERRGCAKKLRKIDDDSLKAASRQGDKNVTLNP
jgi:hypothetical protein